MGSNQAFLIAFLKEPSPTPTDREQVAGQLMGSDRQRNSRYGRFSSPIPPGNSHGRPPPTRRDNSPLALSGIDATNVYGTAAKIDGEDA